MLKHSLALGLIIAALVMSACGGASSPPAPQPIVYCDVPRHLDRHGDTRRRTDRCRRTKCKQFSF